MEINLKDLAQNKRLSTQLARYVAKDMEPEAQEFLLRYFPSQTLGLVNHRIIMDMADLLASLYEDDDIDSLLLDLKDSMQSLIANYYHDRDDAVERYSRVEKTKENDYVQMSSIQRQMCTKNPGQVNDILHRLDACELALSYTEGYEYEEFLAYRWLEHNLDEAIANKRHTTKAAD